MGEKLEKILNKNKFKKFHENFKNNCSAETYNSFVEYLNKQHHKFKCNINLIVTDSNNIPMYNSKLCCKNTYNNYKNGKITFNNIYENRAFNISEINGYAKTCDIYKQCCKKHTVKCIVKKIGSSAGATIDIQLSIQSISPYDLLYTSIINNPNCVFTISGTGFEEGIICSMYISDQITIYGENTDIISSESLKTTLTFPNTINTQQYTLTLTNTDSSSAIVYVNIVMVTISSIIPSPAITITSGSFEYEFSVTGTYLNFVYSATISSVNDLYIYIPSDKISFELNNNTNLIIYVNTNNSNFPGGYGTYQLNMFDVNNIFITSTQIIINNMS